MRSSRRWFDDDRRGLDLRTWFGDDDVLDFGWVIHRRVLGVILERGWGRTIDELDWDGKHLLARNQFDDVGRRVVEHGGAGFVRCRWNVRRVLRLRGPTR